MAAPLKPWERGVGQNNQVSSSFGDVARNQHSLTSGPLLPGSSGGPTISRAPPPLPTRPTQQGSAFGSTINRYGSFGNGFGSSYGSGYGGSGYGGSGYGGSGLGSYGGMYGGGGGMYGGGMYGGGMYGGGGYFGQGQIGSSGDPRGYNQYLRRAEENSRPAFQSIESIVQAFGSVSMMMESTLQTVYNSFRAVIGVADHFSRLKAHLAHIFTALALFRTLRYVYRRILVFLGLKSKEFAEELWEKAQIGDQVLSGELEKQAGKKKPHSPSWPIFMFFAVVVGGPYIIWKLLCSTEEDEEDQLAWASGDDDHVVARAEFDFDAEGSNELSFKAGAMINLAPKELQPKVRGWVLASVNGKTTGLIPANYIKILGKRRGQKTTHADLHEQGQPTGTDLQGQPTGTDLQGQPRELSPKLDSVSENLVTGSAPPGNKSQEVLLSIPATHSELNLDDFDKAFTEAPRMSHQMTGSKQTNMEHEWSAWEIEEKPGERGNTDKQTEEKDN